MVNNGIVVFISGRGSNLNAIINAVNGGVIKYPIAAVVSDRYWEGIEISRKNKLNTLIIDHKKTTPISISKNILRAETAAIAACAILNFQLNLK